MKNMLHIREALAPSYNRAVNLRPLEILFKYLRIDTSILLYHSDSTPTPHLDMITTVGFFLMKWKENTRPHLYSFSIYLFFGQPGLILNVYK